MPGFAELVAATHYSFLDGASAAEDVVARAHELGLKGIGIADRNTVAGVVRALRAWRKACALAEEIGAPPPPTLVVGARLVFADGTPDIVAYPVDRTGWGRLTRLLTLGNKRARKGGCILGLGDLIRHAENLLLIALPTSSARPCEPMVDAMLPRSAPIRDWRRRSTGWWRWRRGGCGWGDHAAIGRGSAAADGACRTGRGAGVPLLATTDTLFASPADRPVQDILTCIREGLTIRTGGRRLAANAERHLKAAPEMARLFADRPGAVAESMAILDRILFRLDHLSYDYPHEPVPEGWAAQDWLEELVRRGRPSVSRMGCPPSCKPRWPRN